MVEDGTVEGVVVMNKSGRTLLKAKVVIDCTGDGDAAVDAGAPWEIGDAASGNLQPVTMVYRMQGVDTQQLLGLRARASRSTSGWPNTRIEA